METERSSGHTHTFWLDSAPGKPETSILNQDLIVETCVVGAGIAGLSTAYFLAKQGRKVAVIDAGEICSGETGRTTGYLTWVIDDGIANIKNYYGLDGAMLHVNSHRDAVSLVERIVNEEKIDCQFRRVPGYWFSRKPKPKQAGDPDVDIIREFTAMKEVGMTDITIVDRPPYAVDDGKCIKIPRQGQFHSVAYCYGLAKAIMESGGLVYTHSKIKEWKDKHGQEDPYVTTIHGSTVRCKNIVLATNIPLQLVTTIAKLESNRTYVVAGELPKDKYEWCVFQDDSMSAERLPYKYGRFASVNDATDILLVGGEDNLVGAENVNYDEKFQKLEAWTKDRYPDINLCYRWSGQVQEPVDFVAYIGPNPGCENVYIITGDSGMGMTHGTIGGKLISDEIMGVPNPWRELYDPTRLKLKAIPHLAKHLTDINLQYKDYFMGSDVPDIESIANGEGAIICKGIHRYAVYKDEQGKIHACSATCSHLKGQVRWNPLEKSWDCPVHGSRFDSYGHVLNGPAKTDLPEVSVEPLIGKKGK